MAFNGTQEALAQAQEYGLAAADVVAQFAIYLAVAAASMVGLSLVNRGGKEITSGAQKVTAKVG